MTPRQERRIAHAAIKRIGYIVATEGTWSTSCVDRYRLAVDCTKPRPRWRFW